MFSPISINVFKCIHFSFRPLDIGAACISRFARYTPFDWHS